MNCNAILSLQCKVAHKMATEVMELYRPILKANSELKCRLQNFQTELKLDAQITDKYYEYNVMLTISCCTIPLQAVLYSTQSDISS